MSERRLARRLVVAAALAVLAVIVASAFIRHAQALHPAAAEIARIAHRLGATAALLLIVMVPFMALRGSDARRERRVAHVALAIVIALAVLGVATPGSRSPLVVIGNLAGGFALFGTLVVLAMRLRERHAPHERTVRIAIAAAMAAAATGFLAWLAPSLVATLAHNATAALVAAALAAAYLGRPAD